MNKVLPPISRQTATELPGSNTGTLPIGRAQAYVAVLEDAIEQLAVLEDIVPEAMKTDNKQVNRKLNNSYRKKYQRFYRSNAHYMIDIRNY
jgi:hypothetical protein